MSSSKNLEFEKTAFLTKSNSAFIEEMYMKFVNNDPTLPDSWKRYFDEIGDEMDVIVNEINGPSWSRSKKFSLNQFRKEEKNYAHSKNHGFTTSGRQSPKRHAESRDPAVDSGRKTNTRGQKVTEGAENFARTIHQTCAGNDESHWCASLQHGQRIRKENRDQKPTHFQEMVAGRD